MLIGMACGVGLRAIAVFATFFISLLIYAMTRAGVGTLPGGATLVRVVVPSGQSFEDTISPLLAKHGEGVAMLATETVQHGAALEVTYRLVLSDAARVSELIKALQQANGNNKVRVHPDGGGALES